MNPTTMIIIPLLLILPACGTDKPEPPPPAKKPAPPATIEEEVRGNVLSQPIGVGQSVADLGLGDALLSRIVDRVIQASYQERSLQVQGVVTPPESGVTAQPSDPARAQATQLSTSPLPALPEATRAYRERTPAGRPAVRGFRTQSEAWPVADPLAQPAGALREAAEVIARGLAPRGLLRTLVEVVAVLGPAEVEDARPEVMQQLKELGFPVDLLRYFDPDTDGLTLTRNIATDLRSGATTAAVAERLAKAEMRFVPSAPDFRAASESGEVRATALRLQLSRGDSWGQLEDGGGVKILRQLVTSLPGSTIFAHIEPRFIDVLRESVSDLSPDARDRIRVLHAQGPVSQWAQDNGKAGSCIDSEKGRVSATLIPRYTSRRQDGSEYVAGESHLYDALRGAGHRTYQSPLLFQGGDVLVVEHPKRGERWAFVGESEIARNRALGLTNEQVSTAFAIEFGVDRCVVLPSISFHIDYDVTFRVVRGELVAFVEDTEAAVGLVLKQGIRVLREANVISAETATELRQQLDASKTNPTLRDPFFRAFSEKLFSTADGRGAFPLGLIRRFSDRDIHRGIGNFQRVMSALDQFAALALTPAALDGPGHQRAHLRAYRRQSALRADLVDQLGSLDIRVKAIPSFSDGARSITTINGVQVRGAYLLPTYGGKIASAVDAAAKRAFESVLGDEVRVIEIQCAESQRRSGALHCSVATYPELLFEPTSKD